jgi:acetoin:2,6-dichlorophenolindophenol oxidoreductase subunit alpha
MTVGMSAPLETELSNERLVEMLRQMFVIRAFDEALPDLYTRGLVRGSSHAAIGQEAVAVGACAALRPDDQITSTHRGHGHTIAKGGDLRRMAAELFGRESGYCHGKGGSMHIADFSIGMLGANGIVGGGFGIAAGAALTAQLQGAKRVALCFFGEGAINQGAFHGVANIAAIWKLPVVFLCENNQFAMSARVQEMTAVADLADRAVGYRMPGMTVDGVDPLAVHAGVSQAVRTARAGQGPSLVVATCYRFAGHFSGDTMKYRTEAEARPWLDRDPVVLFRETLVRARVLDQEDAEALEAGAKAAVRDAHEWAMNQPEPAAPAAWDDLYA